MDHVDHPFSPSHFIGRLLSVGYVSLLLGGCAGMQTPVTTIHQDVRSTVFLENVSDKSFQAAHPIKLDEATISNVLRGVHTKEKTGLVLLLGKALKSTNLSDIRTFLDDEVAMLAPHITAALAQASPNQRVGFRLYHSPEIVAKTQKGQDTRETTAGYLAADGLSINFTLTQYRYRPGKVDKNQKAPFQLPDPTGLRDREVNFIPETALRPESTAGSSWFGSSDNPTLVIDYHLLGKLLASPPGGQPIPAAQAAGAQPLQPGPVPGPSAATSDAELRAFKEELKAMQKKLDDQNAELLELKKSSAKNKSAP